MESLSRETELRNQLAILMARSDELLAELQAGREKMHLILSELEKISVDRVLRNSRLSAAV